MSKGKLDERSWIDYPGRQDFQVIREDNGQRGDCRIEIRNQKTRRDTTIPEPGIRPHEPLGGSCM